MAQLETGHRRGRVRPERLGQPGADEANEPRPHHPALLERLLQKAIDDQVECDTDDPGLLLQDIWKMRERQNQILHARSFGKKSMRSTVLGDTIISKCTA